jgi:hypothetical protein
MDACLSGHDRLSQSMATSTVDAGFATGLVPSCSLTNPSSLLVRFRRSAAW